MRVVPAAILSFAVLAGVAGCATVSREQSLVERGISAMGGASAISGVKTVAVTGQMKQWEPEQSDAPGGEMRFANESRFETVVDVANRAARTDYVRNFAYPSPRTFTFSEIVTPEAGYVIGIDSNGRNAESLRSNPPAHSMSGYRLAASQRELRRLSPGALLVEMRANPAAVQPAADIGRHPALRYGGFIVAFDPATGLPSRVRSLDYDGVLGDVSYDAAFSDWRDVGGVKLAHAVKHELNGRTISDAVITGAAINQSVDAARLAIPSAVRASAAKPATGNVPYQWVIRRPIIGTYMDSDHVSYDTKASQGLRLQPVAPGVDHVVGGTHNSLLVEMSDHLIVFDAPIADSQSQWVVNAARMKYPGKPIRWLVLTHHHMDHSSGVRGFLAEGATLVVGQGAAQHWQKVLSAPTTRNPDLKGFDANRARIVEVTSSHLMDDPRGRQVIAYYMDSPHAKGTLMGYVPDARLGFVTDIWTPGPPLPAKPNPGLVSVVSAVKKYNLQPERFAGGHGATAEYAGLARLAGQ